MHKIRNMRFKLIGVAICSGILSFSPAAFADIILSATVRDFCGIGFGVSACPAGFTPQPDFERAVADDPGLLGPLGTGIGPGRKPVLADPATPTSTISRPDLFPQWFNDTAGVNQTTTKQLTLTGPSGSGIFSFNSGAFFPIDDELLGNEGQSHNYSFTLELHTTFTYQAGQTFNFTGDDDVWVFINDRLVIDLGGVHGAESAAVDLDTLGLTAGNAYNFDLFFAERHTSESNLRIDTSIVLDANAVPEPGTLALLAAGLVGLLKSRKLKKT